MLGMSKQFSMYNNFFYRCIVCGTH